MRPMASADPGTSDPTQLQLENDLLTNEVERLRKELARAEGRSGGGKPATGKSGKGAGKPGGQQADARGRQAIEDVTWLVERLSTSPAGWMLKSRPGFRALMERYGKK